MREKCLWMGNNNKEMHETKTHGITVKVVVTFCYTELIPQYIFILFTGLTAVCLLYPQNKYN